MYLYNPDKSWLVGNLEYTTEFENVNVEYLENYAEQIPRAFLLPEDLIPAFVPIRASSRDSFMFGRLVQAQILPYCFKKATVLHWDSFIRSIEKFLDANPENRGSVSKLLDHPIFAGSQLVHIMAFLNEYQATSKQNKTRAFQYSRIYLETCRES